MSKLEATNVFSEGLITDLNPITTPNNVLTNALNATLITMNGNEFVLQNDLGNGRVETAKLPTGFVPLGVKEYGGIIYVASYDPITKKGQLGSFPSPERNLTQDEIGNKNISVSKSDFSSGDTLTTYYKRIDVMPEGMYLNPGDKFGLFITGPGYDLLSYHSSSNARAITFHPAIIDDYGTINYIDEECKIDGVYRKGLIFGSPGDLSTVDGYREAFDKLLVYKGKKSGKLVLIVELETLDDFVVSRSVSSNKEISQKIGSSDVKYSDEDSSEKVSFKLTFNNSGWAKPDNELIKFTGVKFESNFGNFGLTTSSKNNTISYSLDNFTRDQTLKYKIIPYTQLGACEALARTGIVNFSLFGTGNIILNEWRYYVDNNKIRINYGLDTNLLEGESIKEVSFEFFDIYYNTIYKNKFICGSTINGNYNGNYTETLNLPYDLNYKDTYSSDMSNKDYIANSVVGIKTIKNNPRKYTLKSNELLKNNLYCVKITVTTTGLNTGNQIRTFYRFLWTTGYFNEEYIKNEESNFSVLQVPSKYIPKFKLKCEYDIDSSDFALDYLNNPTQNGADSPFIYSSEKPTSDSSIRANLYQDWKLSNAKIKVTTKLESEDANSLFGDYNAGWFSLEDLSNTTITYDNNNQIINKPSGELSAENSEYIDITNEELSTFDNNRNVTNLHNLLEKANYSITFENLRNGNVNSKLVELKRNGVITDNEYKNALEWIELINDSQLYTEGTYKTSTTKEGEDPIITISNIEGRLIRRLTGNLTDPNYTTAIINELRPCVYTNMTNSELSVMVGGASVTVGTDIISNSGEVLYLGSDAGYKDDDATKIYSFWGKSDNYVNNMYLLQQIGGKDANGNKSDVGQAVGLSYDIIRRNLADVAGHSAIYLLQGGIHDNLKNNGSDGGIYKCPEDFGSLGVGFYTENSNKNNHPYNTNFMVGFKEEGTLTYVFSNKRMNNKIVTIVVWRTSDAGDNNNQFAAINLGSVNGYNGCITNCVTPILKIMHILHKNIERELWITKLSRMAYHGIFPTKVNIGYSINKDSIKAAEGKCPIKLYDNEPFNEKTVKKYLQREKWNIEEDKWFKNIESTTKNVLQCSYINIPYDKIDTINENNTVIRSSVDIDLTELTELGTDTYLLGVTLDLGTQIDASIIYDQFTAYLNGESVYKPTLIYIDKGTSPYELLEGVDSLGNPFSANNIYYKTAPGVYVSGSSDEATKIKLFSNETCTNLKNLFVVGSINGSPVPVLNNNNLGNRIEKLSTNVSDGGNRKHISDIRMCRDIYLRNSTYKPLK